MTLDEAIEEGFDILFEVSKRGEDDDGNPAPWYCNLFYGDSNGPHKPGTLVGIGYGTNLEMAFENAVKDLKHPYDR